MAAFGRLWDLHIEPVKLKMTGRPRKDNMPAWKRALIEKKKQQQSAPPREGPLSPPTPPPPTAAAPPAPSPVDGAHTVPIDRQIDWGTVSAVHSFTGGLGSSGVNVVVFEDGGVGGTAPPLIVSFRHVHVMSAFPMGGAARETGRCVGHWIAMYVQVAAGGSSLHGCWVGQRRPQQQLHGACRQDVRGDAGNERT